MKLRSITLLFAFVCFCSLLNSTTWHIKQDGTGNFTTIQEGIEASTDSDTGYLATRAGVDNKKLEEVIKAILKEYKKISEEEVSPKELKKAKEYIKGKTSLSLETSAAQASFYTNQELLEDETLSPEEIFKKIDAVTSQDILRVAKNIFQVNKLNFAMIGPAQEEQKIKEILNQWK